MYEEFFGLKRRAFSAGVRLEDYFPSASMEYARQMLRYCLERGAGWGLVIGAAGLGKTLLCHCLAQELGSTFRIGIFNGGGISRRRELWQTLLYTLGEPYRGMEEGELRLALLEYVRSQQEHTPGLVLMVDDAHLLPGRLLEELRILGAQPGISAEWLRVMLAGAPVLEERLSHPRLEALQQRIVARCYLEPWNRRETQSYIRQQLHKAGQSAEAAEIIPPEAAEAVFQATGGIPRLVNQLCDQALLWASQHHLRQLNARSIETVWAELQQLPSPSAGVTSSGPEESIIEFGLLEEEEEQTELAEVGRKTEGESVGWAGGGQVPSRSSLPPEGEQIQAPVPPPQHDAFDADSGAAKANWPTAQTDQTNNGPEEEIFFGDLDGTGPPAPDLPQSLAPIDSEEAESGSEEAWHRLEAIENALAEIDRESMGSSKPASEGPVDLASCPPYSEAATIKEETSGFEHDGEPLSGNEQPAATIPAGPNRKEEAFSGEATVVADAERANQPLSSLPEREGLPQEGLDFRGTSGQEVAEQLASRPEKAQRQEFAGPMPPQSCPPDQGVEENRLEEAEGMAHQVPHPDPILLPGPLSHLICSSEQPEIELVFQGPEGPGSAGEVKRMEINPFGEGFLEEEWIIDPYLQLDMEGYRPWSVMELQCQEKKSSAPGAETNKGLATSPLTRQMSSHQVRSAGEWGLSHKERMPEVEKEYSSIVFSEAVGHQPGKKSSAGGELPLIVIEDQDEEPPPEPSRRVAPVARHEYRRLFARLRRG